MSKINLLKVDGVVLPNPSVYDPTYSDLDSANSYTSETGVLNRDMIRANHRKLDLEWTMLKFDELQLILTTISADDKLKPSFQLEYLDLFSGRIKTGTFYATDRGIKSKRIYTATTGFYTLSLSFIEF